MGAFGNSAQTAQIIPSAQITVRLFARNDPLCIQKYTDQINLSMFESLGVARPSILSLFVCLLLNGTSALFRPLVPRIVEIEHTNHVKNDLKYNSLKKKKC